jgi:hypothetical protein
MFFEKLKEFEERVEQQSLYYIANLRIELQTGLTLETRLLNALHTYFLNPKSTIIPFQSLLLQLTHAASIKKTQGRLCGGILKRGDRAYKCL